jgi:hypothetical protein
MLNTDSVTSIKVLDGTIVNADINASAAIAGTKISPDFGSQNITTTNDLNGKSLNLTHTSPQIQFIDSNGNPDYTVKVDSGLYKIIDTTNSNADRFVINTDGHIDIAGNLDVGAGLDVTGAITGTGDLTIDTTTFHVDASDNRVGIGTTSPDASLDIAGNTDNNIQAIMTRASDPDFQIQFRNESSSNNVGEPQGKLGLFHGSNDIAGFQFNRGSSTGAGSLSFTTGGTERMRIDSSGNVGIG